MLRRRLAAALVAVGLLPAPGFALGAMSRNMDLLAHLAQHSQGAYSACGNYVHADGREYVALGAYLGTSIVDVTDPSAAREVAFIPGPATDVREMKQYRSFLYVTAENPAAGIQIIRMEDPDHPVLAATFSAPSAAATPSRSTPRARSSMCRLIPRQARRGSASSRWPTR